MKRRNFLHVAATGVFTLSLPGSIWFSKNSDNRRIFANPDLLNLIGDSRCVREIGLEYGRVFPDENDAQALIDKIISGSGLTNNADESVLKARLESHIQEDFTQGHIVQINGWILSITEARQCALFAIVAS